MSADGINLSQLSDDGVRAMRVAASNEQQRRHHLESMPKQAAAIARQYVAAGGDLQDIIDAVNAVDDSAPDPSAIDSWAAGGVYGPGALVTHVQGGGDVQVWRNQSGAWLTVSPQQYPQGWALVDDGVDGSTPDQWAEDVAYAPPDLVEYEGDTYQCIQAHTSQVGWEPSVAVSLWMKVADDDDS